MNQSDLVLVAGTGGFIGGHLVAELRRRGHQRIPAVDIKPTTKWHQRFDGVGNLSLDRSRREACEQAATGSRYLFIELNRAA